MQQSLNQIWDVAPRPSRSGMWVFIKARGLSLTIILAIGFLLLVSLLLWVNYFSLILLFGAAFTRAHLESRGVPVRPKSTAVCVHRELIEEVQEGRG